jgi:hypothetical protein
MKKKKNKTNIWVIIITSLIIIFFLAKNTGLMSLVDYYYGYTDYETFNQPDITINTPYITQTNMYWDIYVEKSGTFINPTTTEFHVNYEPSMLKLYHYNGNYQAKSGAWLMGKITSLQNFYKKDMRISIDATEWRDSVYSSTPSTGAYFTYGNICDFELKGNNLIDITWEGNTYSVFNNGVLKCTETPTITDMRIKTRATYYILNSCGSNCDNYRSSWITINRITYKEPTEPGTRISTDTLPTYTLQPGTHQLHEFVFNIETMQNNTIGRFEVSIEALPEAETTPREVSYNVEVLKE